MPKNVLHHHISIFIPSCPNTPPQSTHTAPKTANKPRYPFHTNARSSPAPQFPSSTMSHKQRMRWYQGPTWHCNDDAWRWCGVWYHDGAVWLGAAGARQRFSTAQGCEVLQTRSGVHEERVCSCWNVEPSQLSAFARCNVILARSFLCMCHSVQLLRRC